MSKIKIGLLLFLLVQNMVEAIPKFRILAPEFICPKDENTPIEKPDSTVITIQTAAVADYKFKWSVRWAPLVNPSQRFTLLLWRAIRALEAKLNAPQPLPLIYAIENKELLEGVIYVFSVNAVESDETLGTPKTFQIDNSQGHQKLENLEGRTELFSVLLVGGDLAFSDMEFVLEAEITSCFYTQDYYFKWTVKNENSDENVDTSQVLGYRLKIPPYTLKPGSYYAECGVIKHSNGYLVTKTGLNFEVLLKGLSVYLNVDYLVITTNEAFSLKAIIINPDYADEPVNIVWDCVYNEITCEFDNFDNGTILYFPRGLQDIGSFRISVQVSVLEESASAVANVETVAPILPVIQISPMNRLVNEGSVLSLTANVSNVAPTCSLTWYFATEQFLITSSNETCDDCQHGEALSDTVTIFSLQENFLNELTDYTNETEWRQITAEMPASAGRARFVAVCGCSYIFECDTQGTVYADINLKLNKSPKPKDIVVTPESGLALETVFSLRTVAVVDPDVPLRYSFYCSIGVNNSVLLGSYLEYLVINTFLPFVDGGIKVWVEVCDSLGACAISAPKTIVLGPGEGSTLDIIIMDIEAYARRCEIQALTRDIMSAISTYQNSGQDEALTKLSSSLLQTLTSMNSDCIDQNHNAYLSLVNWLEITGIDMSSLYNNE